MKKVLVGGALFLLTASSLFGAYTPSKSELELFGIAKIKINSIYNTNPNTAYNVKNNISKFYTVYKDKEVALYFLNFIESVTDEYIKDYEEKIKLEEEKREEEKKQEEEEAQTIPTIDNKIDDLNKKLSILSKEATTISQFELTPQNDSIYLKNVYLQNIGTVSNMDRLFEEVYLVDRNNRIYSRGYAQNNYLHFDVGSNQVLLKEGANNEIFVKAVLRKPSNQSEIGELKFNLATPSSATYGTLNGINAISYANGKYVTINNTTINNPIITYVTYNNVTISSDSFTSTYNEGMIFSIYNNSTDRLDLKSFDIQLQGSAINTFNSNTKFIVKIRGTNQIFGTGLLYERNSSTGVIKINYGGGSAYNYISANSRAEYVVEVDHAGANPTGNRELRLYNVVVGDGDGGTSNLSDYNNTSLPGNFYTYRY